MEGARMVGRGKGVRRGNTRAGKGKGWKGRIYKGLTFTSFPLPSSLHQHRRLAALLYSFNWRILTIIIRFFSPHFTQLTTSLYPPAKAKNNDSVLDPPALRLARLA